MIRPRTPAPQLEARHVKRLRELRVDGRPLSAAQAQHARDLAALWLDLDVRAMCLRGAFVGEQLELTAAVWP